MLSNPRCRTRAKRFPTQRSGEDRPECGRAKFHLGLVRPIQDAGEARPYPNAGAKIGQNEVGPSFTLAWCPDAGHGRSASLPNAGAKIGQNAVGPSFTLAWRPIQDTQERVPAQRWGEDRPE